MERVMSLRDAIGIVILLSFNAVIIVLFFRSIPSDNMQLLVYMLGQLSGFAAAVVALHYGRDSQDEKKTENTGKAFDAIAATANANSAGASGAPLDVNVVNPPSDPIPTKEE
jgi:hypothetical protein